MSSVSTALSKTLHSVLYKLQDFLSNYNPKDIEQDKKSPSFLDLVSDLIEHIKIPKSKKSCIELSTRLFTLIVNLSKKFQYLSSEKQFIHGNTKNFSIFILEVFRILDQFYRPTLSQSIPYEIEKLASNILTSISSLKCLDVDMTFEFFRMSFNFIKTILRNKNSSIQNDILKPLEVLKISDSSTLNILHDFVIEPAFDHIIFEHLILLKKIILSNMMNLFNWIAASNIDSKISKQQVFSWIIYSNGGLSQWISLLESESYYDRICHYISKWSDGSCTHHIAISMKIFCLKFQNSQWSEWISQTCSLVQSLEKDNNIKEQSEMILSRIMASFSKERSNFLQSWKWIHVMNYFITIYDEMRFLDSTLFVWKSISPQSIGKVNDTYIPMDITWYIGQIYWNILSGSRDHFNPSICIAIESIHVIDEKYIHWYLCQIMSLISTSNPKQFNIHIYSTALIDLISLLPLEYHQKHNTLEWLIIPLCQFIQKKSKDISCLNPESFHRLVKLTRDRVCNIIQIWMDMVDPQYTDTNNIIMIAQYCYNWISNLDSDQLISKLVLYGIKYKRHLFTVAIILYSFIYTTNDLSINNLKELFCTHKRSLLELDWNDISIAFPISDPLNEKLPHLSRSLEILHQITIMDCLPYNLKIAIWKQLTSNGSRLLDIKDNTIYSFLYFSLIYDMNSCILLLQSINDNNLFLHIIKLILYYRDTNIISLDCLDDYWNRTISMFEGNSSIEAGSLSNFIEQDLCNQLLYHTLSQGHWNMSLKLISMICRYCNKWSVNYLSEYQELYRNVGNRLYYSMDEYRHLSTRSPLFAVISVSIDYTKNISIYSQQIIIQLRSIIAGNERNFHGIEDCIKKSIHQLKISIDQKTLFYTIAIHVLLHIVREEWYLVRNQDSHTERYSSISVLQYLLQCYHLLKRIIKHEMEYSSIHFIPLELTMLFRDTCWFISFIYSMMGSFRETIYYYKQGSHSIQNRDHSIPNYYDIWYKYLWNDIELGSSTSNKITNLQNQNTLVHPLVSTMIQTYSLIFNTKSCDNHEDILLMESPSVDKEMFYTLKSMIYNHMESLGKQIPIQIDKISYLKRLGCQDEMALFLSFSRESSHNNVKQILSFLDLNITSIRPCIVKRIISRLILSLDSQSQTLMIQLLDKMMGISFSRRLLLNYPIVKESSISLYKYCFIYCTLLSDRDDILVLGRREGIEHIDTIMIDIRNYSEKSFHKDFCDIMIRNKETTKIHSNPQDIDKNLWWESRNQLDQEFCSLLETLEHSWLGIFVYWFLPICYADTNEKKNMMQEIDKLFHPKKLSLLEKSCLLYIGTRLQSLNNRSNNLIIYWLLTCWVEWITQTISIMIIPSINQSNNCGKKHLIDQIMKHLSNCFKDNENPFISIKNDTDLTNHSKITAMFISDELQYIPWESLPTLRTSNGNINGFCRLSCMQAFHFMISNMNNNIENDKILYVINPEGDLSSTEKLFVPVFSKFKDNITGFVGTKVPLGMESSIDLTAYSLYIYMGHGNGEQYVSPCKVQSDGHFPTVFLMGCSSGAFQSRGNFDDDSIVLEYLFRKSPAVVATLWDVTDKDIDRFTMASLENWGVIESPNISERLSLGASVHRSRSKCLFQGIVGSAPVIYGLGHLLYPSIQ